MDRRNGLYFLGSINADEREQLYNEIWTDPLKIVAEKYEISDSTLRKYCSKFGIPLPPRGYWEKVKNGKNAYKPPLPKVAGDLKKYIRNYVIKFKADLKQISDDELRSGEGLFLLSDDTKSYIKETSSKIKVQNQLRNPHSFIVDHQEEMIYRKKRDKEIERASFNYAYQNSTKSKFRDNKPVLPIDVSPQQMKRVYRIIDALLKIIPELEGFVSIGYSSGKDTASFVVMNTHFNFDFKEEVKKRKTLIEKNKEEKTSNGNLILLLNATGSWNRNMNEHLVFKDTNSEPLETKLDKVIIEMFVIANKIIAKDELYSRELERKWEEERRLQILKEMRRKEEENIKKLEKIVSDWDFAKKIRGFADSLEMKAEVESDENDKKILTEWLSWIRNKADWLDPLITKEDELLGKRKNILDFIKQDDL